MSYLLQLVEHYGLIVVFLNVFAEQAGAPVPAYPVLVVTGALAWRGEYPMLALLMVAVSAALLADYGWYLGGRRFGRRVMALLCRISLSPDSCVRRTESVYLRFGAASLLFAKFIPGFASVASALAGALGTAPRSFVLFDALGAALWAGTAILLGALFHGAIGDVLGVLAQLGEGGLLLLTGAFAIFLMRKWWQRVRFLHGLRMARITVDELHRMLQQGERPIIVDVRSAHARREGRIPGAVPHEPAALQERSGAEAGEVIVYCACPNEASAARVAKALMQQGYRRVRPLHGGIDAWVAAGYALEEDREAAPQLMCA